DLLESPLPDVPGAPDFEVRVLLFGHRVEQQQDLGARRRLHPLVDRSSQKLLIRQVRPLGAARPDAVEHELERIEYRRLPRAVGPADFVGARSSTCRPLKSPKSRRVSCWRIMKRRLFHEARIVQPVTTPVRALVRTGEPANL